MNVLHNFIIDNYDIIIVLLLLFITVVTFKLMKADIISKKWFFFELGVLTGIIVFMFLNSFISHKTKAEIEALKEKLKNNDKEMQALRAKADVNNEAFRMNYDSINNERIEVQRNVLIANACNEQEKERIKHMDKSQVLHSFNNYLSN